MVTSSFSRARPVDFSPGRTRLFDVSGLRYVRRMTQPSQTLASNLPKIVGRTRRLPSQQRAVFDQIFHSGGGYVLDFSDRTMAEWFEENFDIQIFQQRFQVEGASKAKTLRGFVEVAEPRLVAQTLRVLWA